MTETIPTGSSQNSAPGPDIQTYLADILLNVIVALMAPMFISASAGDPLFARMAALQTVNAYRAQNQADLISVAQIIAFGLAALGSLGLSMADDLSLSMMLRLRSNANACNRSAEQNRRALRESLAQPDVEVSRAPVSPSPVDPNEAEIIARVAATQQRAAEAQAKLHAMASTDVPASTPAPPPEPVPTPEPVPPAAPVPPQVPAPDPASTWTEQEIQMMWGAAMAQVAGEYTAELPNLPPSERWKASRKAAALSTRANELLSGTSQPRPRPGDLAHMIPPPRP